jgi:hypothetical protein
VIEDMTTLEEWRSFYGIVGPSAGTLIGLQFVVMTLIANMPKTQTNVSAGTAYTTPTVIHFGVVLLLSAVGSAPWDGIAVVAATWGLVGLAGVVYIVLVARRLRVQSVYHAVFEDWLFHALLPLASYAMLIVSAYMAYSQPRPALCLVAAVALQLLFIGIHNAWDLITYHVLVKRPEQEETKQQP